VSVRLEVKGVREVVRAIRDYAKRYPKQTAKALYAEGFGVQGLAMKLAPVEFAVLRASAYTAPPTLTGGTKSFEVETGFGTEYAVKQHEELRYRHPRGGQAKYLEAALKQRLAGMLPRLRSAIEAMAKSKDESGITPLGPTKPKPVTRRRRATLGRTRRRK